MIPLRDDIPSRGFALINYGLIAANVAVFAYELHLGRGLDRFLQVFGLVPVRFNGAEDAAIRFIPVYTSMFLHGGWLHLVGNMLFLNIFGDNVEDRLGHVRYLLFYLGCGTIAALVQVHMFEHSSMPMVGASGAIAGVTGAYFVFYPRARVVTLVPILFFWEIIQVPAVVLLLLWFVMQVAYGMTSLRGAESGGVAWWAHIGGFGGGALFALLFSRRKRRSWTD